VKFFKFVQDWEADKPDTHQGMDVHSVTAEEVFA